MPTAALRTPQNVTIEIPARLNGFGGKRMRQNVREIADHVSVTVEFAEGSPESGSDTTIRANGITTDVALFITGLSLLTGRTDINIS